MALIHWKPFHMDDFFEDIFRGRSTDLAADVYENDNNVVVKLHIPGINPDKIDISFDNDYIRVSGSRDEENEIKDQNYYHKEIRSGSFERLIPLPAAVDEESTRAESKDGILRIFLPKQKKNKKNANIKVEKK
jgi:HSP20 family protein